MLITPFQDAHREALVEAWNSWSEPRFQIDLRLLGQLTFDYPDWSGEDSRLAWRDDRLVGFALVRNRHLDAIAVDPKERRKGLGRKLLEGLEIERFGGGFAHFVPGVPQGWEGAERFLQSLNFTADWWAEDLFLELQERPRDFTTCHSHDREPVVRMVSEEFSRRWTRDTEARFECDDQGDVVIIKDEEGPVAFCLTWHFQSRLLGPSVYWLRNSCEKFGGIGPVGVRERARGRGLGGRIVVEALNYLAHRGVEEVVVDWTAIGDFYKKYGFQSWQRYRGYARSE